MKRSARGIRLFFVIVLGVVFIFSQGDPVLAKQKVRISFIGPLIGGNASMGLGVAVILSS